MMMMMSPATIFPPLLFVTTLWTLLPTTTTEQKDYYTERNHVYWTPLSDKLHCGDKFWKKAVPFSTQLRIEDYIIRWGPTKQFFGTYDRNTKLITALGKRPVAFNVALDKDNTEILFVPYPVNHEVYEGTLPTNLVVIGPVGTEGSSEPIFLCLPFKPWEDYYAVGISYNRECHAVRLADGKRTAHKEFFMMTMNRCQRPELITDLVHYNGQCEKGPQGDCENELRLAKETILEKEAVILELEATIRELEATIREKEATIQEKEVVIREKETIIQEKETTIQEKEETIKEKETIIQEKEATIREKEATIQEKEVIIREKETIIQENQVTIQEKETTIRENQATIREKEETIREKEETIREKEATIQDREATISGLKEQLKISVQDNRCCCN